MPESVTVCGLPARASSEIERVPERAPKAVGVKVTLMVQLAPAASEAEQLLLCAKSPLALMEEMFSDAVPVFVRVTGWAGPAVPTS